MKIRDQKLADPDADFPGKDYPTMNVLASFMASLTVPSMMPLEHKTNFGNIYCSATQAK